MNNVINMNDVSLFYNKCLLLFVFKLCIKGGWGYKYSFVNLFYHRKRFDLNKFTEIPKNMFVVVF